MKVYEGLHGDIYKSIASLARAYNIAYANLRRDIVDRGLNSKDAVYNLVNKLNKQYEGLHNDYYDTIKELAEAYNINPATFQSRLKKGMSIKEALEIPVNEINKEVEDHLKNKYRSIADMCDYYKLAVSTFKHRIDKGWSLEKALTTPALSMESISNEKKRLDDLCKQHNICRYTLRERMKKGMSLEEALNYTSEVKDHLDNIYSSKTAMCEYYNVPVVTFIQRIKRGWSLEKALTTSTKEYTASKRCKDHDNNEFDNIKEMCKYWGIEISTYYSRLKLGWPLEKILTTHDKTSGSIVCYDHKNKRFNSLNEMCRHWKVPTSVYKGRIASGMSVEQALTTPVYRGVACTDGFGNEYSNIKDMCITYNFYTSSFYRRVYDGIETCVALIVKNNVVEFKFLGLDGKARYRLSWSDEPQTARQIIEHYRPDLIQSYDKHNPTGKYEPYRLNKSNKEENTDERKI